MARLMSVSLTETAVVERRKTVTRRLGWKFARVGDQLQLCRKVMGRRAGEPLVRLAVVELVHVSRVPLWKISSADVEREGVPISHFASKVDGRLPNVVTPAMWAVWFAETQGCDVDAMVTRLEWKYLDEAVTP